MAGTVLVKNGVPTQIFWNRKILQSSCKLFQRSRLHESESFSNIPPMCATVFIEDDYSGFVSGDVATSEPRMK
jgi:hypothetical protein